MTPHDEFTKTEKRVLTVIVALIVIIVTLVVAVVGAGLYLAVHNWG